MLQQGAPCQLIVLSNMMIEHHSHARPCLRTDVNELSCVVVDLVINTSNKSFLRQAGALRDHRSQE